MAGVGGSGGRESGAGGAAWAPSGRFLARAALLTAGLTAAGALLGLVRDQLLAHAFGAGPDTDAFLIAWTVPEFAATLLIEDAMALLLVPAFSRALARRAAATGPDPVLGLVRATLPGTALAAAAGAALVAAAAPLLVPLLAPGLPEQRLAVDCTRLTATCVLSFALAGYVSAVLRAHGRFLAPAGIYVVHNAGIIAAVLLLGPALGVRAAALGVAAGGALMALVQAPALVRRLRAGRTDGPARPRTRSRTRAGGRARTGSRPRAGGSLRPVRAVARVRAAARSRGGGGAAAGVALALVLPVVVFAVSRQCQVLVERFLAAPLPAGAISHLNYAQKVAQLPMVLSLMLCTVSFPVVARALAAGDGDTARRRAERDLLGAGALVLAGAATVAAAAPQIVHLLFQRGAFDAADTAATAAVMRVYALGLLGHTLVGALVRCYFAASRPLWFPAGAMLLGIAANTALGALWADRWGAPGIALANAVGITLTAALLLAGASRRNVPLHAPGVAAGLARLTAAAAVAAVAARICASWPDAPLAGAALAAAAVLTVFPAAAHALRAPLVPALARAALRAPLRRGTAPRSPLPRRQHHVPSDPAPLDRDVPLGRRRPG
ncbi:MULTISPECIES: lipid II flippase MurJ [Streptomyces]|uniref:Murein biosynthesis protein MurJ n=1 Tax=Streptomyces changanensis TaxID=2964669 RepID=A0ABY5N7H4_9ACTN|nr:MULTISPECIES: lipid II flippase MurJ [Streptomyces]UUS32263.1 murein biosynthesis protein MurJ [Streptomyces changanensis]